MEEGASQLEESNTGKKKRKKRKKKAKSAGENEDGDLDEQVIIYQEPPKLEVILTIYKQKKKKIVASLEAGIFSTPQDDEEFPGLSPALKANKRFSGSLTMAKQCNQVHGMFFLSFFLFLFFCCLLH